MLRVLFTTWTSRGQWWNTDDLRLPVNPGSEEDGHMTPGWPEVKPRPEEASLYLHLNTFIREVNRCGGRGDASLRRWFHRKETKWRRRCFSAAPSSPSAPPSLCSSSPSPGSRSGSFSSSPGESFNLKAPGGNQREPEGTRGNVPPSQRSQPGSVSVFSDDKNTTCSPASLIASTHPQLAC